MINNVDVESFFENNVPLSSFSELSKNNKGKPLVENDTKAYAYEKYATTLFSSNPLQMVDALYIKDNCIWLIEFKGGFNLKISLKNFDINRWYCESAKKICEDGAKYFKENQVHKVNELINSLHGKLLETYTTFYRIILPKCAPCTQQYKVKYVSVVDANSDPLGNIENVLGSVSEFDENTDNLLPRLKASLSKYKTVDANGNPLFFDEILAWSIEEFNRNI